MGGLEKLGSAGPVCLIQIRANLNAYSSVVNHHPPPPNPEGNQAIYPLQVSAPWLYYMDGFANDIPFTILQMCVSAPESKNLKR